MLIANPIYDVVFKYMMEDHKVAKLLISSIIGRDVELLDFSPKEFTTDLPNKSKRKKKEEIHFITIYKLDFLARIKADDEEKIVLIEVQKSKYTSDIMRFRKYLGEQYKNPQNVYTIESEGRKIVKPCEIISIYFLGHPLDNIKGIPVIKTPKKYMDVSNGKEINIREEFLDSLNHESYIVVIPELKERRRNELEILLSVFDQSNCMDNNHIMNVKEEDFPPEYGKIIRRLQMAGSEKEVRDVMEVEDDFLRQFAEKEQTIMDREIELAKTKVEIKRITRQVNEKQKELKSQDKVLKLKNKEIENKDKALIVKNKEIETKDKELETKDKELETKDKEIETKDKELETKDKELETKDKELEKQRMEIEKLKALLEKK